MMLPICTEEKKPRHHDDVSMFTVEKRSRHRDDVAFMHKREKVLTS